MARKTPDTLKLYDALILDLPLGNDHVVPDTRENVDAAYDRIQRYVTSKPGSFSARTVQILQAKLPVPAWATEANLADRRFWETWKLIWKLRGARSKWAPSPLEYEGLSHLHHRFSGNQAHLYLAAFQVLAYGKTDTSPFMASLKRQILDQWTANPPAPESPSPLSAKQAACVGSGSCADHLSAKAILDAQASPGYLTHPPRKPDLLQDCEPKSLYLAYHNGGHHWILADRIPGHPPLPPSVRDILKASCTSDNRIYFYDESPAPQWLKEKYLRNLGSFQTGLDLRPDDLYEAEQAFGKLPPEDYPLVAATAAHATPAEDLMAAAAAILLKDTTA